jgi:hypothetical protein
MRDIEKRIARAEPKMPAGRALITDQKSIQRMVDFVTGYNDVANHIRCARLARVLRRGQRTSGPAAIAGKAPTELYNVDQKAVTDALSKLPLSCEGLNVPRPAPDSDRADAQARLAQSRTGVGYFQQARPADTGLALSAVAGTVISASLVTGLNSDLPGLSLRR